MNPAGVGEEQQQIVSGGHKEALDVVLLLEALGGDAPAAPLLGAVGGGGQALDISLVGQGIAAVLLLDEILHVDFVLHVLDLRQAAVAVLVPQGRQLVLEDGFDQLRIRQNPVVVGNFLLQLLVLRQELVPFQTLQALELHVQNGLGLHVRQAEAAHEVFLGIVIAGADDFDDLVDVVLGDEQALQQVGALLGLAQVVAGPADDDLLLEVQILVENFPQGQNPGLGLVLHQGQHVDGEGGLQGGLGKQTVQHHLGIGLPLQFDDDAHTGAVGLVADVGDALQALVVDLVGHVLDEHPLVDLVGDLRDDNPGAVLAELLKVGSGPEGQAALARGVGGPDAGPAQNDALGGEIGAGDVLHQVGQSGLGVVQDADAGVDDLGEVVGRDVGGHAHGDAGGTVDQQVGEPAGQDSWLLAGLIEVGVPVHGLLFDIPEHLVGDFAQAGLGVTVGSRGVAVHGAEVAVTVHQHIAHGEILGQTHQGVVNRLVSVGMVVTQHGAHAGGGLAEGPVGGQIVLIHGVKDPAVDGLQTVPHIGQGTSDDDGHGILDVAAFHFMNQLRGDNGLIGIQDVLGLVVFLMLSQGSSSFWRIEIIAKPSSPLYRGVPNEVRRGVVSSCCFIVLSIELLVGETPSQLR